MFSYFTETALAQALTSGTEAVVVATPQLESPEPAMGNVIRGRINVTGGATAGAYTVKCRRGTTTGGTQVGATQTIQSSIASTSFEIPFSFVDAVPTPGLQQYCVTLTAGGSNGTVNDAGLEFFVPVPYGEDV